MNNVTGDQIKAARLRKGMTQQQLASAAGGRNVTQINAYERGRSKPSPRVLSEIAAALGLTVDELMGSQTPFKLNTRSITELIVELKEQLAAVTGLDISRIDLSFRTK